MFINTEGEHSNDPRAEGELCDEAVMWLRQSGWWIVARRLNRQRSAEVMAVGKRGRLPCRH